MKCDPFVKLKLLRNFCCDFYGSCLWDLSHPNIDDVCTAWRKGLRRLLGLPYRTHSVMWAPLCDVLTVLPLEYELICRCANFMSKCMVSCNEMVNYRQDCREAAICRYCFYSVAKNQHFAP